MRNMTEGIHSNSADQETWEAYRRHILESLGRMERALAETTKEVRDIRAMEIMLKLWAEELRGYAKRLEEFDAKYEDYGVRIVVLETRIQSIAEDMKKAAASVEALRCTVEEISVKTYKHSLIVGAAGTILSSVATALLMKKLGM
ncbi:MAG: hypothetical protein HC888_10145 [Candidatus Competibacteraceae bacterium]|nr:hypothetical protein [Candidatus Competibacteraceae bacterium]